MSTAYVFTVHQYIEKKKHMFPCSNIHLLIVPPNSNITQPLDASTFGIHPKLKKKHAPPWFHPGNPCENLDPNAKPPRPKTTQPDGFTAQATYAADLIGGETAQDLQVRWRSEEKNIWKKNWHFWEHTMQHFSKKTWSPFKLSWCVYVDGFVFDGLVNRSS